MWLNSFKFGCCSGVRERASRGAGHHAGHYVSRTAKPCETHGRSAHQLATMLGRKHAKQHLRAERDLPYGSNTDRSDELDGQ
jgi:hypothetical protein